MVLYNMSSTILPAKTIVMTLVTPVGKKHTKKAISRGVLLHVHKFKQ